MERILERLQLLLPPAVVSPRGGRPSVDNRAAFLAIAYVIRKDCRWQDLPARFPSPVTCWRRYKAWTSQGIWDRVWREVEADLNELPESEFDCLLENVGI